MNRADALRALGGLVFTDFSGAPILPPRALQQGDQGIVNVRDYGAKGDGVTDDRARIVAANAAAAATRGSVFFPAGNYVVSDYVDVQKETRWYGVGTGSSLIATGQGKGIVRYRPGAPGQGTQLASERNFVADNLFFSGTAHSGHLVNLARMVHARFMNCKFNNTAGNGLKDDNTTVVGACGDYMFAVETASFVNCDFENNTANAGLGFETGNHLITVSGCHFNGNKYGMRYVGVDNGVHIVTGTMFYGGTTALFADIGDVYNLVIEASWAEAQTGTVTFIDFAGARRNFNHVLTANNIRGGDGKVAIHDVNLQNARFSENQFNTFAYVFQNTGKGVVYGPNDYARVASVFDGGATINGAAQVF